MMNAVAHGKLKDAVAYLSGPIDQATDLGIGWRQKFIEQAKSLDLDIIDPCNKPSGCAPEVKDGHRLADVLRSEKDWTNLQIFAKKLRREDLRFTDICDFVVVYINKAIYTVGTWDEVFVAERQKKPIFAIVEGGLAGLPTWLFGVFELNEVFSSVEECVAHLQKLNNGEIELDDRWVLIRDYLEAM